MGDGFTCGRIYVPYGAGGVSIIAGSLGGNRLEDKDKI
jgi:hypothetical protein